MADYKNELCKTLEKTFRLPYPDYNMGLLPDDEGYDEVQYYRNYRYEEDFDTLVTELEALLSKRELEARLVELDLLEQAMNRATEQGSVVSLTPYKIMRLKDLTGRLNKLTNREEQVND